jgi:hypothetical protein
LPHTALTELDHRLDALIVQLNNLSRWTEPVIDCSQQDSCADLGPQLDELRLKLEDFDCEAQDMAQRIQAGLAPGEFRDGMEAIARHLDNYDFEGAQNVLSDLWEQHGDSIAAMPMSKLNQ